VSEPLSLKNGYAEAREGMLRVLACERTTELAVR